MPQPDGVPFAFERNLPSDAAAATGFNAGRASWLRAYLGIDRPASLSEPADAAVGLGWLPGLTFVASLGVGLTSVAANGSRTGADWAVALFYVGLAVMFAPAAFRALRPSVSRAERIGLVLMVTASLFLVRVVRGPVAFIDHDEFLHWRTALDIIEKGRLFIPNPLLPVSPLYPGLEIVTTALTNLSGLSVFSAGLAVLLAARMVQMAALFLVYERVAGSSRIAALACLAFMGSSTFVIFDVHFSYESLAVSLMALVLLAEVPARHLRSSATASLPLPILCILLFALAVTHHLTAYFAAALLFGNAVLTQVAVGIGAVRTRIWAGAVLASVIPYAWSKAMGDPGSGYLGPVLEGGWNDLTRLFSASPGRQLFVAEDGSIAPAWQRYLTLASVLIVCIGLSSGFLRALVAAGGVRLSASLPWLRPSRLVSNPWLTTFTLLTLAFPVSIVFRLTSSGWEIGNRLGPFSFWGVALVVAIAAILGIDKTRQGRLASGAIAIAGTVLLVGGLISAEGPRVLVPEKHQVSADSASIGPLEIDTARWTREWLGRDNVFASDRVGRLLLSTYGRQDVATTLRDWRDTGVAISSRVLGPSEISVLRDVGVEYVMADLRLTTARPAVGVYFDGGASDRNHREPLLPEALLKFNRELGVSRVYDNGFHLVFDVRRLLREQP